MPAFALLPGPGVERPTGLIARDARRAPLLAKINARKDHYGALDMATGEDWMALFSGDPAEMPALPWLSDAPIYLYPLTGGCYCQVGYRPNVPASVRDSLVAALRRRFDLTGRLALTAELPGGRVYDFGQSRPVADVDFADLRRSL